jgi:hypothetical protein
MTNPDPDAPVLAHIQRLASEEHALFEKGPLADEQTRRLAKVQVELDQCWDFLRQRRALRQSGHDAAEAQVRPPEIVEKYSS